MARQKVAAEAADEEETERPVRRSFVTPSSRRVPDESVDENENSDDHEDVQELSTRTAIAGVTMAVIALLCLIVIIGSGGSDSSAEISDADAQEIFALREDIRTAEVRADELPETRDADRGLVTALQSAERVADLQNDYRGLTPQVAAADGVIDPELKLTTRQELTPYFTPSVHAGALEPWYLLAADKSVPAGIGIPDSFDSGVQWVADVPTTIEADGTVPVTWRAIEVDPGQGQQAAVLAWARADYDITHRTFSEIRTGTTVEGEALALEVNEG